MKQRLEEIRFALASAVLILGGWMLVGLFEGSSMNHLYTASWWVKTIRFCCYAFPALAALFGVGGLLFDRRKGPAAGALALSLASGFFVYLLRP
jgi:hypothetical protein